MAETIRTVRADEHVHRLYAEHAALPVGVVTQCAQNHAPMVHAAWQELPGEQWADRVRGFYTQGEECLFDLLSRATTREARLHDLEHDGAWAKMLAAGPRVLDFGGGLGLSSSLLCEAGKQVTYVDVDGAIARFAEWFFDSCGQADIEVLHTSTERPELPPDRTFDLVLADHVLEHVVDPVATIDALVAATADGGLLHLHLSPLPQASMEPHRRALAIDQLLAESPALRAMEHVQCSDDGRHLFRK